MSAFALEDGIVYHTSHMRADWTASGHVPVARPRPKGRNETGVVCWRRHDEYDKR